MVEPLGKTKITDPTVLSEFGDLEKEFNVTREDVKEITKDVEERFKEEDKVFAIGPGSEADKIIASETKALQEEKINKNVQYLSNVTGLPITNESLGLEDFWGQFMLGRLDNFQQRKEKFLDMFPEGEFMRVSAPVGKDEDMFYEIFKTNKNEDNYRIVDPIGLEFDAADLPQGAGQVANFQYLLETIALIGGNKKKAITGGLGKTVLNLLKSPTMKVFFGNLTGKQIDDVVNATLGYGEDQWAKEDAGLHSFGQGFIDFDNLIESGQSAAFYKAFDVLGSYFAKGRRPGLIPEADFIAEIAAKYDLEPLVVGQLMANPLIRKSWFQTKEFTKVSEDIIEGQVQRLKEVLSGIKKGDELTYDQIIRIQNEAEQVYAQRITDLLNSPGATRAEKELILKDAINDWNKISLNFEKKLAKQASDYAADGGIKISGVQKNFKEELNILLPTTKGKKITQEMPDGSVKEITQTVQGGDILNAEVQKFQSIYNEFKKLNPTENFLNDPKKAQKYLDTLIGFRKQLFDMQFSPNQEVAKSARRIYNNLKDRFNPSKNQFAFGSDGFLESLYMLDKQLTGNEAVRGIKFLQEAITTKGQDIVGFADNFIKPGTFQIDALENMLREAAPDGGLQMFDMVRDVWIKNLYRDPSKTAGILKEWQAIDPDGLNKLLGNKYTIDDLIEIGKLGDKTNNSIFKKMIDEQGTVKELIYETIEQGKNKKIGASAAIDDLIMSAAGNNMNDPFMVSARAGIIQDILDRATKQTKSGPTSLDMNILVKEIENLKSNENLMKFFDEDTIQLLEDTDKYIIQLAQGSDVGAVLSAGEKRQALIDGIFNPREWLSFGFTIFKNELLARMLSGDVTQASLRSFRAEELQSFPVEAIKVLLAEITSEFTSPDSKQSGVDALGTTQESQDLQSSAQVPVEVPTTAVPGSSVSSAQVVAPLPTMGAQPQQTNIARAQQAFPFDPVFAAGGGSIDKQGIMNTSRGRQMVV